MRDVPPLARSVKDGVKDKVMTGPHKGELDLGAVRAKLETDAGRHFWRSLEEAAETEGHQEFLHHEFPRDPALQSSMPLGLRESFNPAEASPSHLIQLGPQSGGVSRRDALKFMAASAALGGLTACTKMPPQKIVPYVRPAEQFVPGKPLFYATAMSVGGAATGLLVESNMGRPTKVEGNPDHPGSLGSTDAFCQSSILTFYDPDRSQVLIREGRISGWSDFVEAMNLVRAEQSGIKGAGLRLLTESVISPTLADQIKGLLAQFPAAKWHQYEPAGRDNAREGGRLAFGEYVHTYYKFDQADVVLSLDADFLASGPGAVRYARDFADKRRIEDTGSTMNRLYAVESTMTITGAMADHRLPMRAADVESFARAVAAGLGVKLAGPAGVPAGVPGDWIPALVRDLEAHRGASIAVAGEHQPPIVHAIAHAINEALGNFGKTVIHTDPIEANPVNQVESLRDLANDMKSGLVDTVVVIGANPVFTAPADIAFAESFLKAKRRIHAGLYNDETGQLCHWHVPEAHFLESWSDARAYDGTVSLIQPLISPLYQNRSAHEVLAALSGQAAESPHDLVRGYWSRQTLPQKPANYEVFWQAALEKGIIAGTVLPPRTVTVKTGFDQGPASRPAGGMEIVFRPDPCVGDGRFANNGWLQELPKPFSKLTWDNAALVSVRTAERLGLAQADVVRLDYSGRHLEVPVFVLQGHPNDSITLHFGYGRERAGRIGTGIGFNAYRLRTSEAMSIGAGLDLRKTGNRYHLVTTQNHHLIGPEGNKNAEEESVEAFRREVIRVANLEEFRQKPGFTHGEEEQKIPTLYPGYDYSQGYAWGMSIDLNSCTGCNACVVACYAENNIPVVGKTEVDNGRDMQWLRVDTYYRGDLDNPEAYNQIVICMHCENAPCEYVCPVGATVHSPEGLNLMIYNRCVGTRYCSNNCPYKVRRFNFYLFSDWETPSLYGARNPDVTVRSRGVMEKCSYCVQRIEEAKIKSEEEDRAVRDGEIATACEQACPSKAIVFGDQNDRQSRVAKAKNQSRRYGLLTDLNTRPRTTYLARLRNPNPEIKV